MDSVLKIKTRIVQNRLLVISDGVSISHIEQYWPVGSVTMNVRARLTLEMLRGLSSLHGATFIFATC